MFSRSINLLRFLCIALLTKSGNPHAAPDLTDLIQELVRGQIQDRGAQLLTDFGTTAFLNSPLNIFRTTSEAPPPPGSPTLTETGDILLPKNFDVDADPQQLLNLHPVPISLSCNDQVSNVLYPWQMFDFRGGVQDHKICTPLVVCNSYIFSGDLDRSSFCSIEKLQTPTVPEDTSQAKPIGFGVCCSQNSVLIQALSPVNHQSQSQLPPGETGNDKLTYLSSIKSRISKPISARFQTVLTEATHKAVQLVKELYVKQEEWIRSGNREPLDVSIPDQVLPEARDIADGGLGLIETTRAIGQKLTGTSELGKQVPPASILNTNTARVFCPSSNIKQNPCGPSSILYRALDGSCNNLQDVTVGQMFQPMIRVSSSSYQDGVHSPRQLSRNLTTTNLLPSVRQISMKMVTGESRPSTHLNFGFASHGQFVAYDMSHSVPYDLGQQSAKIRCCTSDGKLIKQDDQIHPLCLPIEVPQGDPFYSSFGVNCIPFVRSMVSSKPCNLGAAQQMNQVTHWLDLSQIYGSLERVSNSLRELKGGRMKSMVSGGNDYLVLNKTCNLETHEGQCTFETGDVRGNQQLYLTMMHTIWRREHNRVANILESYHSDWSDEILFHETRRIVIAEYQHVTYNEFIPTLIGTNLAARFKLLPKFEGYTTYNPEVDASVANEHSTAAFRIGHSMIPEFMKIISNENTVSQIALKDSVDKPLRIMGEGIQDGSIRGFTRMSMENVDNFVSKELTEKLFKPSNKFYGLDLVSLNLQRGRDHGLSSYANVINELAEYCGFSRIASFEDFVGIITQDKVAMLRQVYGSFDEVDLYIGGLLETPVLGGLVGPTFGCIIGDQFSRSKYGDRFHYEHGNLPSSFNEAQLEEIRSTSAARIYCDNSKEISQLQPLALRRISPGNPIVNCFNYDSIPRVDLSVWKEYNKKAI